METALDEVDQIWLKRNPYLAGEQISIADLIGLCEIDQPREYETIEKCQTVFFSQFF